MHRWAVLLALVGCEPPAEPDAVPPTWVYPPGVAAWPLGEVTGRIGRSQAPQLVSRVGVIGPVSVPLRLPTPWPVPGDGPARAIVYGLAGDAPAIEMIEIDAGRIAWRDTTTCAAPVVGVTEEVVVCADAKGTRAVGLDGKRRWTNEETFIAMTDSRVVVAAAGESVILDADNGEELARVKLPAPKPIAPAPARPVRPVRGRPAPAPAAQPISSDSIIASCGDAGRELFAHGQDGRLVRIHEAAGGPKVAWAVPFTTIADIDACDGTSVLVTTTGASGTMLVALARDTGKQTGVLEGVRGYWPARDGGGRLEVSTTAGVALWSRDLVGPAEPTNLPVLGELLSRRGERRLVRATPLSAAILDARGVRAYLPLAQLGAVLGDRSLITASWAGSAGESVRRIAISERYQRTLRVPSPRAPVMVPAELRDLPPVTQIETASAIAKADTAKQAVSAVALDPVNAHGGYVLALEAVENDKTGAGVARFDLQARTWSWYRNDGCGPGTPVALAAARELVVCGAHSSTGATVVATTRDGNPSWQWRGDQVDAVQAAGDVVLVHDADRMFVLDARDGALIAQYTSDDGAGLRAAALDVGGMTMVVTYQRGRVMARLPRVEMAPAWTLEVAGIVRALSPAGDGVLVDLEDGDAYRIDARTGTAVSVPGLDLTWRVAGDVITGQAPGGPIPPPKPAVPVRPRFPIVRRRAPPPPPRQPGDPPRLPAAWPAPPPLPASWQYTLYELAGGLRARNDYALAPPITPGGVRGPGDSPLVVQSGPGLRDVLVIDPLRGDPLRRVQLPDDAAPGLVFSTIVDGKPVVGTLLANPLRVVLF